jgi:two-component sensor histidine kinase
VDWTVAGDQLTLKWREFGGPRVSSPSRRGFGARLIERALAQELRGRADLRFDPEGVICELQMTIAGPERPLASTA